MMIHSETPPIRFTYTNYKGETSVRNAIPVEIHYESTDWHPEEGYLLKAFDLEKMAYREFALKDCDFTKTI